MIRCRTGRTRRCARPGIVRKTRCCSGDPEAGLEADQVPHLARLVLTAQLHRRVRLAAGSRVVQADRLHRAEPQRLAAALRHLLDRQAALEVRHLVELVAVKLVGGRQRVDERFVLFARQRRVEVVVAVALAPARLGVEHVVIERLGADDRRNRIVERQRVAAEPRLDRRCERVGGERPGRNDASPGKGRGLLALDPDERMGTDPRVHERRKHLAINRERGTTRHARLVGQRQQQRAQVAQLGLEQAVRVLQFDGLEGIAADQFTQSVGLVRGGAHHRPHLDDRDVDATLRQRPGGLASGEAAADHGDVHDVGAGRRRTAPRRLPWGALPRSARSATA